MSEQLERSAELIERLLGNPELRRRFRTDPASVLKEHGLGELASGLGRGEHALMTLELRESRSSLAGVMVAAAAEGVDFAHVAEHLAPRLERDAGRALDRLLHPKHPRPKAPVKAAAKPATPAAAPSLPASSIPPLAAPAPAAHPAAVPVQGARLVPGQATGAATGAATGGAAEVAHHAAGHANHHHRHRREQFSALEGEVAAGTAHDSILAYPGDAATSQQIAAWMAAHAQRAGIPPELPLMAALTESGLRNLPYGDRDSVGFFQMRLGIWNEGPYVGYLDRPNLQLKWFIDHALEVRAQDPALAASPSTWGEWVAAIEQPAAQYRYRYQLQLGVAQELLRSVDVSIAPAHPVPIGRSALGVAMHYLGTPYRWGGSSPGTGFDCSGLVQYAYAQEGIQLPRVAAEQFDVGIPVARDHLRPGDAVFFADPNGYVHHVGLYIGRGEFVNAPETGEDVKVSSLSDPYFAAQYAGARRYTAAALENPSRFARTLPTIGS